MKCDKKYGMVRMKWSEDERKTSSLERVWLMQIELAVKNFWIEINKFFPFRYCLKKVSKCSCESEIYLHIRLVIRLYWKGWPFMMMNAQRWRPRGVLRQCIDFELTFPYCLHVTLRNEFFWLSLKTTCKISSLEWFSINFCILPSLFFSRVNFSL